MQLVRRILWLGLFVAALVGGWRFAAANGAPITVDLLFMNAPEVPLWLALLVSFGAGAVLLGSAGFYRATVLRLVARRYRKRAEGLESEVHELRNQSVEGAAEEPGESESDLDDLSARRASEGGP